MTPFASVVDPTETEAENSGEPATQQPVIPAQNESAQEAPNEDEPGYEKGAALIALEDGVTLDQARDLIVQETNLQDVRNCK